MATAISAPSTSRLEAFSDGVIAIVITLLVLELQVPHVEARADLSAQLAGLSALVPQFIAIALSFLMIAVFWVNHHYFFHTLARSDRGLLWYNNLFLFWLALIPFPSAYLGEYPEHTLPVMLFGAIMFAAALSFLLMRRYAHFQAGLGRESLNAEESKAAYRRSMIGPVLYLVAIPAALVSVFISLAIYLAVPAIYFLPARVGESHSKGD